MAQTRDVQNLDMTVVGLQGNPVSNAVPVVGDALVWDGSQWLPAALPPPAPPLNGPIIGVTDGSNAAAGMVGEYMQNVLTASVPIPGSGSVAVLTLNLTPGDWDVVGWLQLTPIGATQNSIVVGIASGSTGYSQISYPTASISNFGVQSALSRVSITSLTAVFLSVSFSGPPGDTNSNVTNATIRARRMR